jgi:PTH1 family peptidyl-tRNA hydrolase
MLILVGLGNPGQEYERTRHNIGFLMLDCLQTSWKFPQFKLEKKFQAEISKGLLFGETILLVKPQTFMNLSGQSVQQLQQFYKLEPQQFWLVYDELDLPYGKIRVRKDGSPAGHNGIKSVIAALGTDQFYRFRIGICPEHYQPGQERQSVVLGRFSADEDAVMGEIFQQVQQSIEQEIQIRPGQ